MGAFLNIIDEKLFRLSRHLYKFSGIVVGFMSIPIFFDVILRFFTGKTIPGVIELEEFFLSIIVYSSVAYMHIQKEHISIDIVTKRLPQKAQTVLSLFVTILSFFLFSLMCLCVGAYGIGIREEVSFQLRLPIFLFVEFAAFGIGLMAMNLFVDVIKKISFIKQDMGINWIISIFLVAILICIFPLFVGEYIYQFEGIKVGSLGMVFLFVLIFLGMPIAFAMFFTGFIGLWLLNASLSGALAMLGAIPYGEVSTWIMVVAPLFILMGNLAYFSGMSQDLFSAAYAWFGRMPGGLAISSVAGCAGFSAVCGDSLATSVTMGSIALPEMKKKGYSSSLATGSIAAGGTLGILIPPSVGFIFYALVTETSIGQLFIAGILPGLLLTFLFGFAIYIHAVRNPESAPAGKPSSMKEKIVALKGVIAMIALLFLILGGILGGVFSPTEGGAIGAVGAFLYALARKRINKKILGQAMAETTKITTKLLLIVAGVGLLTAFLASSRLPFELADIVLNIGLNRYIVLAGIIIFYLLLGCTLNVIAVMLITLPAIFPTVVALGFDPIWFGVISVLLMEMGQITPPIGIIVFAVSSVAEDVPLEEIFKGILPFVLCMIICVLILTIFPQIALFLPELFFGD